MFVDIRGYTDFTSTHGADEASLLVARFTQAASESISANAGEVRGTWGDEVFAVFASARDAVRSAVSMQDRFVAATVADGAVPLLVGVGLDVGEAVAAGEATSGSAVNVAARLCSRAGPGQVLATGELVHLAGAIPGVVYEEHGQARLKGVPGRTRLVQVRSTTQDKRQQAAFRAVVSQLPARRSRRERRRAWVAGLAAVAVVVGTGSWWLTRGNPASPTVPGNSVGVIDTGTGRLLGAVSVGQSPGGVAADGNDVWVVNTGANTVSRVDQQRQVVTGGVTVGEAPVALAVLGKDVWVVNSLSGTLSRVSTETVQVVGTPIRVGNEPSAIVAGFGRLWVTDQGDGQVTVIDPTGVRPTQTIDVGDSPAGIAAGDGAVWVSNRVDDTVSKIDPVTMTVGSPIRVGAGPTGIVAVGSGVWVVNSLDLTVSRIDPTSGVVRTTPVGDTPTAVVADAGSVWVADAGDATVARIDPGTAQVTERLFVGSSPRGLALVGSSLWVAARGFASAAHRGGTLTISSAGGFADSLDPAVSYSFDVWAALHLVYDGLVGLRRTTDVGGYELVPDLAQTLPIPTDDGQTYTFTLRKGIRYADGTPLRATDVRRGIVRTFTNLPALPVETGTPVLYYSGIVGGTACLKALKTCNLDAGIVADDHSGTVTFHLTQPDPDFLAKLTLPFATAAPPGAPDGDFGTHPFPGTGPYQIRQYFPDSTTFTTGSLTLSRNPYFHQWSSAAQPAGYPDVIRWVFPKSIADDIAAVEHGHADATQIGGSDIASAEQNHPALTHHTSIAFTRFLVLNTRTAPFNDIRARRAVAMVLDRAAATTEFGEPARDAACRLVPAGFPGSQPGCPYQTDPLAALGLVKASGAGGRINLYFYGYPHWEREAKYLQSALSKIGYDATLTYRPSYGPPGPPFADPGKPINGYGMGWGADFPAASQYFQPMFSCTRLGIGGYCNRDIATLADDALQTQATNPGKAAGLWRTVYQMLDERAVIIPFEQTEFDVLLSPRVGNYQVSPFGIPEYDQMWVH